MNRERIDDDVVVVGGGIIGLSIAREAAQAGLRVSVVERAAAGREASGAAAGLLSPQVEADEDGPLFRLSLLSRDLYPEFARRVAQESGLDPDLSERGTLVVARGGEESRALDRRHAFQICLGLSAERLGGDELRRLEPSLHPDWREGLYLPRDWAVDSAVLVQGLARSIATLGARLREGTRVDRLLVENGRVTGVGIGEERLRAGSVVIAAGAWSAELAGPGVPPLPVHPVRGQILCLGPAAAPAHSLFTEGCYLVRRGDGRVLAGSTMELAGFEKRVTASGLRDLSAAALDLVPGLAAAPFHSAWAGLRPATPDARPAIGRGAPGLLYACGHLRNGILLAPITARAITRLLLDQDPGIDLAPFDPGRFRGTNLTVAGEPRAEELSAPGGS